MILEKTYKQVTEVNCRELLDYLLNVSGKKLSLTCIRQNIFKTRWKGKENELKNRCEIQAAALYLEYLLKQSLSEKIESDIKTLIAESTYYIRELDPEQDTSFIIASTNSLPSTIHYKHAEYLFYQNGLPKDADKRYSIDILVLYAMRLSLEKRILAFLGIDYIENENGSPVMLSRLFPVIKSLDNIEFKPEVDFNQIKWVWDWLNHFMHRHLRPYPWVIHQAFQVLNPLLLPTQKVTPVTTIHSFYGSTIIRDWKEVKNEIETAIEQVVIGAKINWRSEIELLMITDEGKFVPWNQRFE